MIAKVQNTTKSKIKRIADMIRLTCKRNGVNVLSEHEKVVVMLGGDIRHFSSTYKPIPAYIEYEGERFHLYLPEGISREESSGSVYHLLGHLYFHTDFLERINGDRHQFGRFDDLLERFDKGYSEMEEEAEYFKSALTHDMKGCKL